MKKLLKVLLIIILILALVAVGAGVYIVNKIKKLNYVPIQPHEIEVTEGIKENLVEYRNIALFGIDTAGTYEGSRSDCIIIASINQKNKEIKLVSVYRDTYLDIPNHGLDKVNHAYAYGGPALSMSTLNTNLDLNITEFATVNFTSTQEIIDEIGGIKLTVTDAEATQIPGIVEGGTYELTGAQALAFARIRKIDNDYARTERMRKGRLATMFSVNSTPGLSNYLSGVDERGKKIDILKYVITTEIDNLYIIPSGNVPPNPSELLASEKTEEMLEKLKKTFDIVILDGTPALLVTDALILARLADTTTIVTAYKSTKKEDLAKVKKSIENVGGKIAGVIINKIPIKPEEYKSTYYYGSTTSVEPTRRHQKADYQFETTGNIEENKKQEITEQLNEYLKNK